MLIGIAIALWLFVGAGFGWFRARAKYREVYSEALERQSDEERTDTREATRKAFIAAILEFIKWPVLGLLSAISFAAWIALNLALSAEKEVKKLGFFEALVFSAVVFVLGVIALDGRGVDGARTRPGSLPR